MKYLLITLISLLPVLAKSQSIATYDQNGNVYYSDTIKIPTPVAKQIAKELVSYDSLKAVHVLTEEKSSLLELKVSFQDSIIAGHVQKGIMYEERIKNEQLKFETQGLWIKDLQKQNKKLKVKLTFTKITLSAIIGGLTYLYITK
jgi:hypothetical protein